MTSERRRANYGACRDMPSGQAHFTALTLTPRGQNMILIRELHDVRGEMEDQFEELSEQWQGEQTRVEWILGPGVDDFNALLRELGVEAVETRRRVVS